MIREQPVISVDSLAFRLHEGDIQVLLSKRWAEPFAGEYALPGVLLKTGESISEAAERALTDKLELNKEDINFIRQFKIFDKTNRDPRGETVSVTCFTYLNNSENSGSGRWFNIGELDNLPFDHLNIIHKALSSISELSEVSVYGLLGKSFTTSDYLELVSACGGDIDKSNISRIIPILYPHVSKDKLVGRKTLWSYEGNYVGGIDERA